MKKRYRIIGSLLKLILLILVLAITSLSLYMIFSPQFGKKPSAEERSSFTNSPQFNGKIFNNETPTTTGSFKDALPQLPKMLFDKSGNPSSQIPAQFQDFAYADTSKSMQLQWFGHSTFLIQSGNFRILIDPMFGEVPSPFAFGTKRFRYSENMPLDKIGEVDVVLISHDHYDHLDYGSIQMLKEKVKLFLVPLGVGSHLRYWGVKAEKIKEMDWWERYEHEAFVFTSTPARHFSGRSLTDRDATLWSGWSIKTEQEHLYFSGDGGYEAHFKEIGKRLGKIDLALLECGQYNLAWRDIHMMPEETVQAAIDLGAKMAMPIHWGAFRLAPHAWDESVQRFVAEANKKQIQYTVPTIGEVFRLDQFPEPSFWWEGM